MTEPLTCIGIVWDLLKTPYSYFRTSHVTARRASGIDQSPVIPYSEPVSISTEQTFQTDTIDINALEAILVRMTESVAFKDARA